MKDSEKIKALKGYLQKTAGVSLSPKCLKAELDNYVFLDNGEVIPKAQYVEPEPEQSEPQPEQPEPETEKAKCWYCWVGTQYKGDIVKKSDRNFHPDCWVAHQRMEAFLRGDLILNAPPPSDNFKQQTKRIFDYLSRHPPDKRITYDGIRRNCKVSWEVVRKVIGYFEGNNIVTVDRSVYNRHRIKVIADYQAPERA
ncbi:phage hypothetical protein [Cyanobacterium sp. HL-69]|uniref:hypothetical protein n=1 Tax=Cyanobacterium sp. HL-69 TaxID=2054282 RepID=UPI000CA15E94|nr:phage hypothetical protein [Cyanobacterium sp. HL-69]